MSYLDLDSLPPADLISQYVVECRGAGLFLPYQDYAVIEEWLVATTTATLEANDLLLVLSDVLPGYFQEGKKGRSLSGVRRLVMSRLKDRAMRQTTR